jgi:hypothetical protein
MNIQARKMETKSKKASNPSNPQTLKENRQVSTAENKRVGSPISADKQTRKLVSPPTLARKKDGVR